MASGRSPNRKDPQDVWHASFWRLFLIFFFFLLFWVFVRRWQPRSMEWCREWPWVNRHPHFSAGAVLYPGWLESAGFGLFQLLVHLWPSDRTRPRMGEWMTWELKLAKPYYPACLPAPSPNNKLTAVVKAGQLSLPHNGHPCWMASYLAWEIVD